MQKTGGAKLKLRKLARLVLAIAGAYVFVAFLNVTYWILYADGRIFMPISEWLLWLSTAPFHDAVVIGQIAPYTLLIFMLPTGIAILFPKRMKTWLTQASLYIWAGFWASLLVSVAISDNLYAFWLCFIVQLWCFLALFWYKNWGLYPSQPFEADLFTQVAEWLGFGFESTRKSKKNKLEPGKSQDAGEAKHDDSDEAV